MNVLDSSAKRECTSCQLCAALCARGAIKIVLNDDGFYRPEIDKLTCNDCGLCTRVCYKFDEDLRMTTSDRLTQTQLFSAWSNEDELVRNTTSGGVGDLFAHELLAQGYQVVGCVYNYEKGCAEHRIATNEAELIPFRGSKYIQSYSFDAMKEVVQNCHHEKYAVFGSPCQIYALSKAAEIKKVRDRFVFIDFFCHGCPSFLAWKKYQSFLKQRTGTDSFERIEFRSKEQGWGAFIVSVFGNGKKLYSSSKNLKGFYDLFFCDQILNESCNSCLLRGTMEYTDIRMGDFWGKKYLNNTRGVSGISVITEKGRQLFNAVLAYDMTATLSEYKDFLPYQSYGKMYNPKQSLRNMILDSLKDDNQDVMDACKVIYRYQSNRERLVRYIRTILAVFPLKVTNVLKRMVS